MVSLFLPMPADRVVALNDMAFAIHDGFAVSPGHSLVINKRLVGTWFDAIREAQLPILDMVDEVKTQLDTELQLDGYKVGFNVGVAAGQTVMQFHVHVIPRYRGDVMDPRRGVRHGMPGKGKHQSGFEPSPASDARPRGEAQVTAGSGDTFLEHKQKLLPQADESAILAPLAQANWLAQLRSLQMARLGLVSCEYLGITHPHAFTELLGWSVRESAAGPALELRQVETEKRPTRFNSFQPKSWLLVRCQIGVALVRSRNLSKPALGHAIKWLNATLGRRSFGRDNFTSSLCQPWIAPLTQAPV